MMLAVLVRRLKDDKTYEDFREAWLPEEGFGVPIRVISGQRIDDAGEILTVGMADIEPGEVEGFLARVTESEKRRHDRLSEVVEPEMTRAVYIQVGDDDLSADPPAA